MPLGSPIDESGLLLRDGAGLILQRDDGGRWRLDASPRHRELAGRRVRVKGKRSGFDLVDVEMLDPL